MPFHRLAAPTYPFSGAGTVPPGYDYLNNPSDASVGGAGVPANADGKKTTGPNAGSYFVAFGEDGTSAFTNRGMKALGENTDILDDIVMSTVARMSVTPGAATAGGTISTILVGTDVFVGTQGTPNDQYYRDSVMRIVDGGWNELEVNGVRVAVTLIHDGSNNNVLGTEASGFRAGPTYVNISPSISAGTEHRVMCSIRSSLSGVSKGAKGAVVDPLFVTYSHVSWALRKLLRELHAPPAANQAWNGTWDASIRALASAGLNERYRKSTSEALSFTNGQYNSPGSGAAITRDGQALTMVFPFPSASLGQEGYVYPDPLLAGFRVRHEGGPAFAWPSFGIGGGVGLATEVGYSNTVDSANEGTHFVGMMGPLVLEVLKRAIGVSTLNGGTVLTRITPSAVGAANPDSGGSADARRTLQVGAGDYVHSSSTTALRARLDFIEVTDNVTGQILGTYLVDELPSSTRIRVTSITGGNPPDFGATSRAVKLRLLQTTAALGGNTRYQEGVTGFAGLLITQVPNILNNITLERALAPAAVFLSSYSGREITGNYLAAKRVLAWGNLTSALPRAQALKGYLHGDGSVESLGGRVSSNLPCHRQSATHPEYTASATLTIDPTAEGSLVVRMNGQTSAVQLTVQLHASYIPVAGDKLRLLLELAESSDNRLTVVWPASFKFADGDKDIPTYNMSSNALYVSYDFEYSFTTGHGNVWFAIRRDYV
jgi:hypothetical protein